MLNIKFVATVSNSVDIFQYFFNVQMPDKANTSHSLGIISWVKTAHIRLHKLNHRWTDVTVLSMYNISQTVLQNENYRQV